MIYIRVSESVSEHKTSDQMISKWIHEKSDFVAINFVIKILLATYYVAYL